MANPVVIDLVADTWTKVATAVYTGMIYIRRSIDRNYYFTYRLTGAAAPADNADALPFDSNYAKIDSGEAIDVYVQAEGAPGRVEVFV